MRCIFRTWRSLRFTDSDGFSVAFLPSPKQTVTPSADTDPDPLLRGACPSSRPLSLASAFRPLGGLTRVFSESFSRPPRLRSSCCIWMSLFLPRVKELAIYFYFSKCFVLFCFYQEWMAAFDKCPLVIYRDGRIFFCTGMLIWYIILTEFLIPRVSESPLPPRPFWSRRQQCRPRGSHHAGCPTASGPGRVCGGGAEALLMSGRQNYLSPDTSPSCLPARAQLRSR